MCVSTITHIKIENTMDLNTKLERMFSFYLDKKLRLLIDDKLRSSLDEKKLTIQDEDKLKILSSSKLINWSVNCDIYTKLIIHLSNLTLKDNLIRPYFTVIIYKSNFIYLINKRISFNSLINHILCLNLQLNIDKLIKYSSIQYTNLNHILFINLINFKNRIYLINYKFYIKIELNYFLIKNNLKIDFRKNLIDQNELNYLKMNTNQREQFVPNRSMCSLNNKLINYLNFILINLIYLSFLNNQFIKRPICLPINHLIFKLLNDKINYKINYFKNKFYLISKIAHQLICIFINKLLNCKHNLSINIRPSNFKEFKNSIKCPIKLESIRNEQQFYKFYYLNNQQHLNNQQQHLNNQQQHLNNQQQHLNNKFQSKLTNKLNDDIKWKRKSSKFSNWLRISILMLSIICSVRGTANKRAAEKRILDSIIGQGKYDSRIRPSGVNNTLEKDGPCDVSVNIFVRSIGKISDLDMEYSIQITFREQWNDSRLEFNSINNITYLTLTEPEKIWKPDLFFSNEKEGHFHNIIMPNVLLRIYPHGQVLYSIRISLVLSCPMNLKYYPLDKQSCSIKMGSYGYTTEDLVFTWKKDNPVQVTTNLNLPTFSLYNFTTNYCTSKTNTGEYSCINVDLIFKREFSYYLIQIYIPNSMLVIVSWVSFWLDPSAIPARVSLGVTTLLTMATQISGINASLPPVSYTKAIDVWTGVCLTFVFGALIEFALVNYASRKDNQKNKKMQTAQLLNAKGQMGARPLFMPNNQTGIGSLSGYGINNAMGPLGSFSNAQNNLMTSNYINQITEGNKMKHIIGPPKMEYQDQNFFFDHRPKERGNIPVMLPLMNRSNRNNDMRSCEVHINTTKYSNFLSRWLGSFPSISKKIDVLSRIIFPTMFGAFNIVYWCTYLLRDDLKDIKKS